MSNCIRLLGAMIAVLTLAGPANAQRMVILVRHAEKEAGSGDVALSETGKARAKALARALKDAEVDAIYTSSYLRTKQTAEPLATQSNKTPKQTGNNETPKQVALRLANDNKDQCVVIVGHSNTVPQLIDAITGKAHGITIPDDQFNRLFILVAKPDGKWSLVQAQY